MVIGTWFSQSGDCSRILMSQNALGVAKTDISPSGVESRKTDHQGPLSLDPHLEDRTKETSKDSLRTKSKRETGPCINKRHVMLGMCPGWPFCCQLPEKVLVLCGTRTPEEKLSL